MKAKDKIEKGLDDIEELLQAYDIAKEMYAQSEKTSDAARNLEVVWKRIGKSIDNTTSAKDDIQTLQQ